MLSRFECRSWDYFFGTYIMHAVHAVQELGRYGWPCCSALLISRGQIKAASVSFDTPFYFHPAKIGLAMDSTPSIVVCK